MKIRGKYTKLVFENGKWVGKVFDKSGELAVLDSGKHYFLKPVDFNRTNIVTRYGGDGDSFSHRSVALEDIITYDGNDFKLGDKVAKKGDVNMLYVDFDKNIMFCIVRSS